MNKPLIAKILLLIILSLFIYSLPNRMPDVDDAWIGEGAYWLSEDAYVHSELCRGITGQEDRFIVHHKLLNLHGALFIKLFGFSVYSLKFVSLLYLILFLGVFFIYTKKKGIFDKNRFVLALIILFSFPFFFKLAFTYRAEFMVMFYTFISFIFLEKYIEEKPAWIWLFIGGVFSGLAAATHLNALAVMASGFILLLWNKKWKGIFTFSLGALLAFGIYFYDFRSGYGLSYWLYQYIDSPAVDDLAGSGFLSYFMMNLLNEHMRFFHNFEIIVFTVLMLFTMGFGFKYLNLRYKNMMRYLFLVFLFIALISAHKFRKYIVVYFPFIVIFLTVIIDKILNKDYEGLPYFKKKWIRIALFTLLIIFIGNGFYNNYKLSSEKFRAESNREISEKFVTEDPSGVNIIAPMIFIFNEIKSYNRIHGEVTYGELKESDSTIFYTGFLAKADQYNIDYILLSPVYRKSFGLDDLRKDEELGGFKVLEENEKMIMMKKIK